LTATKKKRPTKAEADPEKKKARDVAKRGKRASKRGRRSEEREVTSPTGDRAGKSKVKR